MQGCIVCSGGLAPAISLGRGVSSDCRPLAHEVRVLRCGACGMLQKIPDAAYLAAVGEIYRGYSIYSLSEGREQLKFQDGVARSRSDIILEHVAEHLPAGGSLLDLGTGSGVFLRAAHQRFGARYELYAHDVSAKARDGIAGRLPLRDFYTGDPAAIGRRFDVVSMIHVLEHLPNPLEMLQTVRERLLTERGVLLVQVPDVRENVFDTVVFDHVSHFTKPTLLNLIEKCGMQCVLPARQLGNETTAIALPDGPGKSAEPDAPVDLAPVRRVTEYLLAGREPMAMFGIAPTGTYCAALLGERLQCFVDEDRAIQFKQHLGRPIYPPERVAPGLKVFLPPNRNSRAIMQRLASLDFVTDWGSG